MREKWNSYQKGFQRGCGIPGKEWLGLYLQNRMETCRPTEVAMTIEEMKAEAGKLRKEELSLSKQLHELQEKFSETMKRRKALEAEVADFEKKQVAIQVLRKGRPPVHQNRRPQVNFEKAVEMAIRGDVDGALRLLS